MRRLVSAFVFVACMATVAGAAFGAAKLKIGDTAPAIKVGKWVKGQPIDKIDPAKVYVIEFWATWCGPCRQSIPHLTELAKKYKDKVTFAGVSVWERGDVEKFVKDMGDKMDYNVATDTSDGYMARTWMEAAGQRGIPSAFVISKGKVVWIGHPMADLGGVLDKVLSGKFDAAAFAKQRDKEQADEEAQSKAMGEIDKLAEDGKPKEALAKLDAYTAGDSAREADTADTRARLLLLSDEKAGYAYIRKLTEGQLKDNPSALTWFASAIIDDSNKLKTPDYALAVSLSTRAVELTKEQDAYMLYVLSQVYDKKGDTAKATESAKKALKAGEANKELSPEAIDMLKSHLAALKSETK